MARVQLWFPKGAEGEKPEPGEGVGFYSYETPVVPRVGEEIEIMAQEDPITHAKERDEDGPVDTVFLYRVTRVVHVPTDAWALSEDDRRTGRYEIPHVHLWVVPIDSDAEDVQP